MKNEKKKIISSAFVIGSTSTIGIQICLELARKGCKKFLLICRDLKRNEYLVNELKSNFLAEVKVIKFDLEDNENAKNIPKIIGQYDLYLICAGYLGKSSLAKENYEEASKIIKINFFNLVPWLTKILTEDRLNTKSRLWILSSVASDIGRPSNYIYGSAKAALNIYCQGVFYRAVNKPFSVRIIKAGFVGTKMSAGMTPSLLTVKSSFVAKSLLKNPDKRGIEYLPFWWFYIISIIKFLPKFIIKKT